MGRPPRADEANGRRTTWTYDESYQLVNEHRAGTGSFNLTCVYDSVRNRLVKNDAGAATASTYTRERYTEIRR